jgi:hypothetical protein
VDQVQAGPGSRQDAGEELALRDLGASLLRLRQLPLCGELRAAGHQAGIAVSRAEHELLHPDRLTAAVSQPAVDGVYIEFDARRC